jgi:uncharacterized membrane protein
MRITLCLLLSATVCLAGWQDENPHKDDYRRTEAWKMSPSLWTPAAAAYGSYWSKDGRVLLVIDDGQWSARGYTASTVEAYTAQTVADCVASGGAWSNGACVYPPPPVVEPTPQYSATGFEGPVLVLNTTDGKGVGVVADGLDLVTYVDHASPRPDAATLAARVAAAKAERQALRDVLKDIRVETTNNIADCVTISASTTNTANAAQGQQIKKLADELADTNRQLNRLRKALLDYLRGTE